MPTATPSRSCFPPTDKMKAPLKTRELVLAAMLSALLIAAKQVMSFLPNFEPVTLLLILYTLHFPRLTPLVIYVFVGVQVCLYGFHLWVYMYLYVWILLYFAVRLLRPYGTYLLWIIVAAGYGMLFGLLCSPVYLFVGGWQMAVSWFVSGIGFDLLHGAGNAVLTAALFLPLDKLMTRLTAK